MKKIINLGRPLRFLFGALLFAVCQASGAAAVSAQESISLTITPPLFQLTASPGDNWSSSLKVVNTNKESITVYASVMNFRAAGEEGRGDFYPVTAEDSATGTHTLAGWISVSREGFVIPREKSVEIPFSIHVPPGAEPGGHYAAILVGSEPPERTKGSQIRVSSMITSLLLVRISGDIREEGSIREFVPDKDFYQSPHAAFALRFENIGNVHLLPQGDITIYNMWGRERGKIPVNQRTDFGNVLPQSTRKFEFEWNGQENFFEAGKYKAVATLSFGAGAHQNVSAVAYFWVVPLKSVAGILGGIVAFILVLTYAIRMYVRKALALEAERFLSQTGMPLAPTSSSGAQISKNDRRMGTRGPLPDAPSPGARRPDKPGDKKSEGVSVRRYILSILLLCMLGVLGIVVYFHQTLIPAREFEIIIHHEDGKRIKMSSEDLR